MVRRPPESVTVAHHQEAGDVHAVLPRPGDVLRGDVRFRAVRGDADAGDAEIPGVLEVLDGADARQQQGGQRGVGDGLGRGGDPLRVGVRAEAVVGAGTAETVAVRQLDRRRPCGPRR
jgi:hypothetical protein